MPQITSEPRKVIYNSWVNDSGLATAGNLRVIAYDLLTSISHGSTSTSHLDVGK